MTIPPTFLVVGMARSVILGFPLMMLLMCYIPIFTFSCCALEMVDDLMDAFDMVQNNATEWGFDPTRVHFVGGSAGGHLALMTAYTLNHSSVRSVYNLYGVTDWTDPDFLSCKDQGESSSYEGGLAFILANHSCTREALEAISPVYNVDASVPMTVTFHGTLDSLVPYHQAQRLHDALDANGVPNVLVPMSTFDHVPEVGYYGIAAQMHRYVFGCCAPDHALDNPAARDRLPQKSKMRPRREKRKRVSRGESGGTGDKSRSTKKKTLKPWPVSKRTCPVHKIRPSPEGDVLTEEACEEIRRYARESDENIENMFIALKARITLKKVETKITREKVYAVLICGYLFMRSSYFRELMIGAADSEMQWFFSGTCAVGGLGAVRTRTTREGTTLQDTALREIDKWHEKFGSNSAKLRIVFRWIRTRFGKAAVDRARAMDPKRVANARRERERRECIARFEASRVDMISVDSEIDVVLKGIAQCFRMLMPHFERSESRPSRGDDAERERVSSRDLSERGAVSSAPSSVHEVKKSAKVRANAVSVGNETSRPGKTDGDDDDDDDDEWEEVDVEVPKPASEVRRAPLPIPIRDDESSNTHVHDVSPILMDTIASSSSLSRKDAGGAEDLDTWAREHGMAVSTYRKRIDVDLVVRMSDETEGVVEQLRDLRKEIERHYLPKVLSWLALLDDVKKIRAEGASAAAETPKGPSAVDAESIAKRLELAREQAHTAVQRCAAVRVLKRNARGGRDG
eukprot:g1585.t1